MDGLEQGGVDSWEIREDGLVQDAVVGWAMDVVPSLGRGMDTGRSSVVGVGDWWVRSVEDASGMDTVDGWVPPEDASVQQGGGWAPGREPGDAWVPDAGRTSEEDGAGSSALRRRVDG